MVLLSLADYESLIDARDHALALARHARGDDSGLSDADMTALLAAPTPLAFWRRKRGLTQADLARNVGVTQSRLAKVEGGRLGGDMALFKRLAAELGVDMEDMVVDSLDAARGGKPPPTAARGK